MPLDDVYRHHGRTQKEYCMQVCLPLMVLVMMAGLITSGTLRLPQIIQGTPTPLPTPTSTPSPLAGKPAEDQIMTASIAKVQANADGSAGSVWWEGSPEVYCLTTLDDYFLAREIQSAQIPAQFRYRVVETQYPGCTGFRVITFLASKPKE